MYNVAISIETARVLRHRQSILAGYSGSIHSNFVNIQSLRRFADSKHD